MDSEHRRPDFTEILWGSMAVVGLIGMVVFEMLLFRLSIGKW
jgi:hypothetical protein